MNSFFPSKDKQRKSASPGLSKVWSKEAIKALNLFLDDQEHYHECLNSPDRFYLSGQLNLSCVDLNSQEMTRVLWGVQFNPKGVEDGYYLICCERISGGLVHLICAYEKGHLEPLFKAEDWLGYEKPLSPQLKIKGGN